MSKSQTDPSLVKSEAEWREQLSQEAFDVTRKHATERPFTSPFNDEKREGDYVCVCCNAALFKGGAKFDSGTGWPSYFEPVSAEALSEHSDNSLFRKRTEVRCSACDAHLGHVFPDGPDPTGLRYCINGVALKFEPKT